MTSIRYQRWKDTPLCQVGLSFHRGFIALLSLAAISTAAEPVEFGRDIYPILQRACFECHGPRKQEADLRFDEREAARKDSRILSPKAANQSELLRRISLPGSHQEIMPNRGAPLAAVEIEKIRRWIEAGAEWPERFQSAPHWAYVAPVRQPSPTVNAPAGTIRTPIDAWVLARLQAEGLTFSPLAEKAILLRRVSLDLIGLPPTPAEMEAFVRDTSPKAFETVVDRLLASPQYGVKWARPWLDYARYADSHGFQRDDFRDLWPYRDWVVNALNADMPFTQFTIEQLAGDLLPNATEAQRIATGFNRSAPTNVEAGSDPEETRVNQVHDRVNTLGMIWLGTTLECAQCHDHKYDPFTQRDYYSLFAFFNHTALEADRTNPKVPGSIQFQGPTMELVNPAMEAERERLRTELKRVTASLDQWEKAAEEGRAEWEAALKVRVAQAPEEHVLEISDFESRGGATHDILADRSVLLSGEPAPDKDTYVITARTTVTEIRGIKLEALTDDSLPGKGPGRGDAQRPNFVLNNVHVTAAPPTESTAAQAIKFASARASFSQANLPVTNLLKTDNAAKSGWAINPKFHEPHWAILEAAAPFGFPAGTVITVKLEQNYGAGRTIGRLRLSILTGNLSGSTLPGDVMQALAIPVEKRTEKHRQTLLSFRYKDDANYAALEKERTQFEAQLRELKPQSTLVMREDTPRPSRIFPRGDFRNPSDTVHPATPKALSPLVPPPGTQPTRLDLARWLVNAENPLVARVVVNRWWADLFGHGLVATPEDFGIKGERPTHPELLDWLACEFMDRGWSQKRMLKTIVMSTTYQQSSRMTPALKQGDDRNRLYARGPRQRLDAELIRDNALAIAGLLNPKLGGPPIKPYQPEGLWIKVGGQKYDYEVSPGEEKYRRGLYVVWKRAAPYPSFMNFDANNRMACRVSRPRSNTPLQALTLMNDPVYVEAAMAFARRVLLEAASADDSARIQFAFRLAVCREPREDELAVLRKLLHAERAARRTNSPSARTFVGSFELPMGMTAEEFSAWSAVTAVILNLDETITKG